MKFSLTWDPTGDSKTLLFLQLWFFFNQIFVCKMFAVKVPTKVAYRNLKTQI